MRANEWVITLVAALALTACGEDGGGGGDPEPVTDQGTLDTGKSTAQNTSTLATIQAGADSSAAQAPITGVGNSVVALANQYQQTKAAAQAMAQGLSLATAEQAQAAGETGSVTFENNHLSADVHYAQSNVTLNYVVDLDIIPVDGGGFTFDGTFNIDWAADQNGFSVAYKYDAAYESLKLDAANCPIDGTLSVDYDLELSGGYLDQLPAAQRAEIEKQYGNGNITLTFGPECGKVTAEGT